MIDFSGFGLESLDSPQIKESSSKKDDDKMGGVGYMKIITKDRVLQEPRTQKPVTG